MLRVKLISLIAATLGIALAVFPVGSRADTYIQTSDHCTGGCNGSLPFAGNTVTVTTTVVAEPGVAGQLLITAQLANNWNFISSGAGGGASFGFSNPLTSLTFTQVNPAFSLSGWAPFPGTSANSPQTVAGTPSHMMDGITFPVFPFYGMTWLAGNGAANQDGSSLSFLISGMGLTPATFLNAGGPVFAADVINHNRTVSIGGVLTNPTGIIDFTLAPAVPLPPAALLFGSALMGLGLLLRRRRKRDVSTTA